MPLHRRSLELRLHLLREGADLLRVDRESARPVGRHPGEARQDHPGPARGGGPPANKGARQEAGRDPGRDGRDHQADLERYMRVQIEESVYYLFTWTQGTFNFEVDVRPEQQNFLVSINPESLLLEGARRVDEWSLIEKKIPSFDLIFLLDKDRLAISEAKLTDTQQRILPLLDGSRDVNQVIEDSGLGEFEIGKALYGLITAGFAHR